MMMVCARCNDTNIFLVSLTHISVGVKYDAPISLPLYRRMSPEPKVRLTCIMIHAVIPNKLLFRVHHDPLRLA